MAKPIDNVDDTLFDITTVTNLDLETLEVVQTGPPVKRFKLDDTAWKSTELTIQPETSDGQVFTINNQAGDVLFKIRTSDGLLETALTPVFTDPLSIDAAWYLYASGEDAGVYTTVPHISLTGGTRDRPAIASPGLNGFYWVLGNLIFTTKNNVDVNVDRIKFNKEGDINLMADSRGRIFSDYVGTMEVYNNVSGQDLKLSSTGATSYIQMGGGVSRTTFAWWRDTDCKMNTDLFTIKNKAGTTTYLALDTTVSTGALTVAVAIIGPNGTAAAPTYRFVDTDTGFYSTGLGNISASINGVQVLSLDSTLTSTIPIVAPNGTAAAPSFRMTDTDTGLYSTGLGNLSASVNGVQAMSLDTTLTSALPIVAPNGTVGAPSIRHGDSDTGWYASAAGNMDLSINGVNRINVNSTAMTVNDNLIVDTVNAQAFVVKSGADNFIVDTSTSTITCHDKTVVHVQDSAAFVVRANDAQDPVMTVDTSISTPIVTLNGELILDRTDATALVVRKNAAGGDILVVDTNTPLITANAQIATLNGSAAAPSIRMVDTDTGLYSSGLGNLDVSVNGVNALNVSTAVTSALPYVGPNGSAAAPTYRFADADTGFYASANGAIDVTNNGTQRMQFSANGDLILTAGSRGQLYSQYVGLFEIFNTVSGQNMQISTNGASGYVTFGDRTAWAFFRKSDSRMNTDQFRIYDNTGTNTYLTVNTSTGLTTLGGGIDFSSTSFKTSSTITLSSSPALSIVLYYLKIGSMVNITWKKTTWTGAATLDSSGPASAIPSAFRPGTGPVALITQYESGGSYTPAALVLETTGYIKIIDTQTGSATIGATSYNFYGGGGSFQV
jgi:hypothetical protein